MTTTRLRSEFFWRSDPAVEAARKHPAWAPFHRRCGERGFFFDHIEREGRNGPYGALCFAVRDYRVVELARGTGRTPVGALVDAHNKSGRGTPETLLALMELQT